MTQIIFVMKASLNKQTSKTLHRRSIILVYVGEAILKTLKTLFNIIILSFSRLE